MDRRHHSRFSSGLVSLDRIAPNTLASAHSNLQSAPNAPSPHLRSWPRASCVQLRCCVAARQASTAAKVSSTCELRPRG
eukprot:2194063-Pyramimonas_sp.AAC.1